MGAARARLGILGGTFDPVHAGHLSLAEAAREEFDLARVVFLPAHCPPHKDPDSLAPVEDRVRMVDLAIGGRPGFASSLVELSHACPTYVGDSIEAVRALVGPAWSLFFLVGADAIRAVASWDTARLEPGRVGFLVAERAGTDREAVLASVPPSYRPCLSFLSWSGPAVSSTLVRERLARGESIEGLVPESVEAYIREHGLYGSATGPG